MRRLALAVVFAAGCTVGAPPGFSAGDSWTVPLVGPLEDGLLLVPALVNGKGPYVFLVDPDAHVSIVDQDVVNETGARTGEGPHLLDESDTQRARYYAEILSWQLGTLTVQGPKPAQIVAKGAFDAGGRRIHGVIGRDIIADSLVFKFDRDAGVITLTTLKTAKPTGTPVSYTLLSSRITNADVIPLSRKLVKAEINGVPFTLHVDFGASASQLRSRSWAKAKLTPTEGSLVLVDEVGMPREVKQGGVADVVSLAGLKSTNVAFVSYDDKRWPDQDLEGTLGLSFFKPYSVAANWDSHTLYLQPRPDPSLSVVARIGRWQSKTLMGCEHLGCIKATITDPLAGKPPEEMPAKHPGVVVSFARDASAMQLELEVLVAVTPAPGKPQLKWMLVNLPAGADRALTHLPADYLGATLTVLDAGFFPRSCPAGACVDLLTPPFKLAANAPSVAQEVAPGELKKTSGDDPDLRDPDIKQAIKAGDGYIVELKTTLHVCIDAAGAVSGLEITRTSGLLAYDVEAAKAVKTWRYEPYLVGGKATAVCTTLDVDQKRAAAPLNVP